MIDATRIPSYEVERMLGRGGMGAVYLARDRRLDRRVALKVLRLQGADAALLESGRERFLREARASAAARHDAIVPLLAADFESEPPFVVYPYLAGGDLGDEVLRGPAAPRRVAEVGARMARALAHLHEMGILHRDVKPSNILLAEDGTPYLGDLGLASLVWEESLTRTGQVVGTLAYMPTETLETGDYSEAGDAYALGVSLLELATGKRLEWSKRREETIRERAMELAPGPVRVTLLRLTRESVDGRLADLGEVAEVLGEAARSPGTSRVGPRRVAGARTEATLEPGAVDSPVDAPTRTRARGGVPRSRAPVGTLFVLLLALGFATSPGRRGGAPADGASGLREEALAAEDRAAPGAGIDPDLPRRAREELGSLMGARVDEERRVILADGEGGRDAPPLVDGDPHTWSLALTRLPAMRELLAWLHSRDPETPIPPALGEEFARTDAYFRDQGYPEVLTPALRVRPRREEAEPFWWGENQLESLGKELRRDRRGWFATAFEQLEICHAELVARDREFRRRSASLPGEVLAAGGRGSMIFGGNLGSLFTTLGVDRMARIHTLRWLRPQIGRLRAALVAAARSAASEPANGERLAAGFQFYLRGIVRLLFFSELADAPMEHLLPAGELTPVRAALEARILLAQLGHYRDIPWLQRARRERAVRELGDRIEVLLEWEPASQPGRLARLMILAQALPELAYFLDGELLPEIHAALPARPLPAVFARPRRRAILALAHSVLTVSRVRLAPAAIRGLLEAIEADEVAYQEDLRNAPHVVPLPETLGELLEGLREALARIEGGEGAAAGGG